MRFSEGAPECSSFQPSEIIDSVLREDHVNICEMFHGCQCDSWEHNDTKCCHHVPISLSRLLRNANNDYHVIKIKCNCKCSHHRKAKVETSARICTTHSRGLRGYTSRIAVGVPVGSADVVPLARLNSRAEMSSR